MIEIYGASFEGATVERRHINDGTQVIVSFKNGYQASIVDHSFSYGVELAVMRDGVINYDTPITDNVLGHLDEASLRRALVNIAALPKPKEPIHVDFHTADVEATDVVNEFGRDYSLDASGCTYVTCTERRDEEGILITGPLKPVCLVGHILARLGVSMELLEGFASFSHERDAFLKEANVTFTDKAYFFLDTLQVVQDSGETWGLAIDLAYKMTNRRKWLASSESLISL